MKFHLQSECLGPSGNLMSFLMSQVGSNWLNLRRKLALMLNVWGPRNCYAVFLWSHSSSFVWHLLVSFTIFDVTSLAMSSFLFTVFFPLALFEFESLLVLKIPFSVRLGFLIHLKFLISEYLSHFCSDSLFCNEMSVKKKPNSCLFFFFFRALKLALA